MNGWCLCSVYITYAGHGNITGVITNFGSFPQFDLYITQISTQASCQRNGDWKEEFVC